MTSNKTLATDVSCVRHIGLSNWIKDFHWPVSDAIFRQINEVIIHSLEIFCCQLADDELDIVLSDGFVFTINQFAHASIVRRYCEVNNYELLTGKCSLDYFEPSWDVFELSGQIRGEAYLKLLIRSVAKNLLFNSSLLAFKRIYGFRERQVVGIGSNTWLKQEFIKKNDMFVNNTSLPLLLNGFDDQQFSIISKSFFSKLESFIENLSALLNHKFQATFDTRNFLRCWTNRLSFLHSIYTFFLNKKNNRRDAVLITETGNPLHKIIASVWRRQGKKAIGFHHGHFMGEMYLPSNLYNELPSFTDFVLPVSQCVVSYNENYCKTKINKKRQLCFSSVETGYYLDLWTKMQKYPFRKKISKVMIMGYPMVASRFMHLPGCFFAFQLDLEIRLIQLLKHNGIDVYYKIHPENIDPLQDILKDLDVNIVYKPFEQTWNLADALIVKYSSSTTFAFALCTNKPIFMLDYEREVWKPAYYEFLTKRCTMIPSSFSEQNRIEFDSAYLLEKLNENQDVPDYEYLKRYMFPNNAD